MLFSNLLNRSILTHPEFSLMISTGFFFLSVYNFLVFPVIYCRSCCLYIANNFRCIPVFCAKLGLYLVILQSLCLLYKLPKCDLLFILHVSFLLLLFFSSILLPLSNFQYRMTGLDWEFVTIFRSQSAVTILILVPYFCFLIHSLMIADLLSKHLHVAVVYTATVIICAGLVKYILTFWRRNYFSNFSTTCI